MNDLILRFVESVIVTVAKYIATALVIFLNTTLKGYH